MDEDVANFTAITSADTDTAAQYLRLADGNLEAAVQLFFEGGLDVGGSSAPATSSAPPVPSSTRPTAYSEDAQGIVHIDSDEDEDMDDLDTRAAGRASVEDDEAMARRMQEELYGASGSPEGVRAPMARTTETLVGPGADWGADPNEMQSAIAEQLLARERARAGGRPGIFNQQAPSSSIWGADGGVDSPARRRYLSRATGGASDVSSKNSTLAEMFRPPFEIMSNLPWDNARDQGKEDEKWLLVDVQNPGVFDCQRLNRDIWKDKSIQETVKENFVFLQYSKDDPKGAQYIQYYFPAHDSDAAYPHVAIVDPRTGEQVKVWSGNRVPSAGDFLMQLHEFLDRYSLKANARNPVATRKPPPKQDVTRMTEEEMLEMAMRNSLENGGGTGPAQNDPDALTRDDGAAGKGKGKGKLVDLTEDEAAEPSTNGNSTEVSPFAAISSSHPHQEPANDPNTTTRIQFRYSGGRMIRRFALSDPVRRIYEWLKASPIETREGMEFELKAFGKDLIDQLDTSIQDAGLKNGTVMVEFLGDE